LAKKKILIVDDDPQVRDLLQLRLKILGYDVCGMAGTGEEAVQIARETNPDIVIMDIRMPGKKDGIVAAHEIRAQSHPRVIFLWGFSDQETIDRMKEFHPDGYILKPFTDTDIRVALGLAE
jgi:DNA-binding NarL/FixJ family response regulator